ncbi:MAG TPA: ACP S-malonyltransferase, partial [Thermoanaerobaculia bacterium]|nr:ACP S-malonyltransferase [Thermoanaerobaculia bacterium]
MSELSDLLGEPLRSARGLDNLPAACQPALLFLRAAAEPRELIAVLHAAREEVLATGRAPRPASPAGGPHRVAILADDVADLAEKLATAAERLATFKGRRLALRSCIYYGRGEPEAGGKTAFLFPGQGSQYTGMLAELCLVLPRVRHWFEDLDASLAGLPIPAPSLLAFPPASGLTGEQRAALHRELYEMRGGAQLGLVANLALHEIVIDLGLRPDMTIGHSNGEHAALFASGAFRAERGELFSSMRRMVELAISLPPPAKPEAVLTVGMRDRSRLEEVLAAEAGELFYSMINCPSQCVLAGSAAAVERAAQRLSKEGGIVVPLPLGRAYHTPFFAAWGRFLRQLYEETEARAPRIPVYTSMTGALYPDEPERIRDLAAEQWANPVDFERAVHRLYEDGARLFIEIGPDNKMKGFVDDILRGKEHLAVSTSNSRHPALQQLYRMVGELFVYGVELDFGSPTWRALERAQGGAGLPAVAEALEALGRADREPLPVEDGEGFPSPGEDPRLAIVQGHFTLMQQFLESQGRVFGLVSASPEPGVALPPRRARAAGPSAGPPTIWPLLGEDIRCADGHLEAERR